MDRNSRPAGPLLIAVLTVALTACSAGSPSAAPAPAPAPATPAPSTPAPSSSDAPPPTVRVAPSEPDTGATPAPDWLGTRELPVGPAGWPAARVTPPELRDRRIVTVDYLAPPADGAFHATIDPVSPAVQRRSTWSARCPVALSDLRYVTVGFRGFDGRAHTGELIVHRSVAQDAVAVFAQLFAAGFPIERMRVTSPAEVTAPPTGDGNTTSAFVCRPVRGRTIWSAHAYGLAIDVDPFQNPYRSGQRVLPELATAYLDRGRKLPGMITAAGPVVAAFRSIGWTWGGGWSSPTDLMHFSSTGR
ncbi:MAG TPA: M15 family metallopeptidase [Mycobacteriales bacterium]